MNRNVVLYIAHEICDHTIELYIKLRDELPYNFDIWWCKDPFIKPRNKKPLPKDILFLCYESQFIHVQNKFWNPNYILEELFYPYNTDYDFYYVVEYDVIFSGNWGDLFKNLDQNNYTDLICAYIKKYNRNAYKYLTNWMWFDDYEKYLDTRDLKLKYYLKSCLSFYRISKRALDFIVNYKLNNIKTFIYEFYLPTLLFNYNYSIGNLHKTFNENDQDSDIEFNMYNYIVPALYGVWYKTNDINKIKLDAKKYNRDLLITTYKSR